MPSQSDYDRINKHMIAPLCVQFGMKKMEDEVIEGYVEDLERFSEETLKAAFKQLRREAKRAPSLAQVIEACKGCSPKSSNTAGGPVSARNNGYVEKRDDALANRVMRSDIGQFAIKHGVGYSVWLYAWRDSREITKHSEVMKLRNGWLEVTDRIAGMPESSNPELHAMYRTLQAKEAQIAEKYKPSEIG